MAESAATPIDLDDTLPEGVYQIDPLFKAIVDGDLNGVKHWLQGFSVDCTNLLADCGSSGCTPLERAAYHGRVEVVKYLIGEGADINRRGQWGYTPLHSALFLPRAKTTDLVTCIQLLIAAGADVNTAEDMNCSPLESAIRGANVPKNCDIVPPFSHQIVNILLRAGANISDQMLGRLERGTSSKVFWHPYLQKIVNAGGIKAYAKAHRQQLATMFVRTRCFQPVPDDIVPLIVDYVFHVGFY